MKICDHPHVRVIAVVVCLFWYLVPALGQIPDSWQSISQEDVALKENPADRGSAAMILERQVYTDDERRLQTACKPAFFFDNGVL
jgi:hypothetical protein